MKYSWFDHPNSVCLTYLEHCKLSLGFSIQLCIAGCKAFIHAFFPNSYITSTSDIVTNISKQLKEAGCHEKQIQSYYTVPKNSYLFTNHRGTKQKILLKPQLLELEIKLNRSPYGHEWKDIGDKLYNCYTRGELGPIIVNDVQYRYLLDLLYKKDT
tara:strand:- start:4960 stop:5427 length:468 start_codon:yes stop_codon:yes gene_type:complete